MAIQEGIQHGPYISQRQTEQKKSKSQQFQCINLEQFLC
jgi:hypothetical protein